MSWGRWRDGLSETDSGFPFPATPGWWGTGIGNDGLPGGSTSDEEVALVGTASAALGDECSEGVRDGGGSHLGSGAQRFEGERDSGLGEQRLDTVESVRSGSVGWVDGQWLFDVKGEAIAAGAEMQGEALGRGGGAMLDGQSEAVVNASAAKIQVTIPPRMKL